MQPANFFSFVCGAAVPFRPRHIEQLCYGEEAVVDWVLAIRRGQGGAACMAAHGKLPEAAM